MDLVEVLVRWLRVKFQQYIYIPDKSAKLSVLFIQKIGIFLEKKLIQKMLSVFDDENVTNPKSLPFCKRRHLSAYFSKMTLK